MSSTTSSVTAIFGSLEQPAILLDASARISEINAAGCSLLGLRREDAMGTLITALCTAQSATSMLEAMDDTDHCNELSRVIWLAAPPTRVALSRVQRNHKVQ